MIHASNTWAEVEVKQNELRKIIDEMWDQGNWETALKGEKLFTSVKTAGANAAEMRRQTNKLISKLELIEAYRHFPLS